ncbi:MAG TPA: hypothetical protein VE465_13900 [Streptosporangiaceae bacterium]|jgi:hypothetical protein|nr:hypothetical protein [Streptosporangiaceae bacterium]
MSSISNNRREPLSLKVGDVITEDPYDVEGFPGKWTVATPPTLDGDQVWINVRSGAGPGVFVVNRAEQLAVLDAKRAGVINGLRELADFIEAHPDLPVDGHQTISFYAQNARGIDTTEAAVVEVDRVAKILGVESGPRHQGGPHHYAQRAFGRIEYEAVVCGVYDKPPAKADAPATEQAAEAAGAVA